LLLSKLYIDRRVADHPGALAIQSRLKVPSEIITDVNQIYASLSSAKDPVQHGKQILFLTKNKGAFIRPCPGTRFYTCCNYMILHIGAYCGMDCSYCILQTYFHPPFLQFFVNLQDMLSEIDRLFLTEQIVRIGTGEFTDSLIWEPWTDISKTLIPKFADQSRAVLELKTKTSNINGLKQVNHNHKTILAWSLNAEKIIHDEERFTASLASRLESASKSEEWGYPLAFHFDPLIIYDGCEADYRNVLEQVFRRVSPENIVWISLGTFRFISSLKPLMQKRFPDSRIVYGEFISGLDGKMRYFKPLRIKLYSKIVGWIKEMAPDTLVYLCMEDDEVWQRSLGFIPSEHGGLSKMLDESARRHCGLF
jgi:spore photoproduct lyase